MEKIQQAYTAIGAEFCSGIGTIQNKLKQIKAFVYDWDGVFNNGEKGSALGSTYKEADSMGTNLLRFAFWLKNNRQLPLFGIITGANNETALGLALREHFQFAYIGTKDKATALAHLCKTHHIEPREVAFFFDDLLDLPISSQAGLRFLVRRNASPLFMQYVKEQGWCDYICANDGANFAVRETAELLISLFGVYQDVIELRMKFQGDYEEYLNARNAQEVSEIREKDLC